MNGKWPTRTDRAKEIENEAGGLALRARAAGLDVVAYILELAVAEARKEQEQQSDTKESS